MTKKTYDRKYLRRHFATGIYVSIDGLHAERDTKNSGVYEYPIYREESGRAYIFDKYLESKYYLDELVLTCFRGLPPKDGKTYYPYHTDGDMKNSNISNLKWCEETPTSIASYMKLEKEAWYKNRKIKATLKGQIKQGAKELPLIDFIYDPDIDWTHHCPPPWVRYEEKNRWGRYESHSIDADKVFEDLGLVNGDKSQFATPVILHRNNDYMDYSHKNLEWCDAYDQRYIDFVKLRHDAVMKKDHDTNYRLDEKSWETVYHGKEPYQDWTDRPEKRLFKFYE
jgi:hypothetical protein